MSNQARRLSSGGNNPTRSNNKNSNDKKVPTSIPAPSNFLLDNQALEDSQRKFKSFSFLGLCHRDSQESINIEEPEDKALKQNNPKEEQLSIESAKHLISRIKHNNILVKNGLLEFLETRYLAPSLKIRINSSFGERCFSDFFRKLSSLKHLESLEIIFSDNVYCGRIDEVFIAIGKLTKLESLKLQLPDITKLNDKQLSSLMRNIEGVKKLKVLDLSLELGQDREDAAVNNSRILRTILVSIKRFTKLESLCLSLNGSHKSTSQSLKFLAESLSQLKLLKSISLTFGDKFKITNKGFTLLISSIKELKALEILNLDFTKSHGINEAGLSILLPLPDELNRLKSLSLKFITCDGIDDKSLAKVARIIGRLKNLKALKLHFLACLEVTDKGLVEILQSVNELVELKLLELNFSSCYNLSDEGLAQGLALPNLRVLNLSFDEIIKITDNSIGFLLKIVQSFIHLKSISLSFDYCGISKASLIFLSNILSIAKGLEELYINFKGIAKIDEISLAKLGKAVRNLPRLEKLSLNFEGANFGGSSINNNLQSLFKSIGEVKTLKSLWVNFSYCEELSDESLTFLIRIFGKLKLLEVLKLNFTACNKITNGGIVNLAESINMWLTKKLKKLSLDFGSIPQINENSLNAIFENIKQAIGLEYLGLRFNMLRTLRKEEIDELCNKLYSKLPKLKLEEQVTPSSIEFRPFLKP